MRIVSLSASFPAAICLALLAAPAGAAKAHRAPPAPEIVADNPEMDAIVAADQADRNDIGKIDWSAVTPRDEARKARTKALMEAHKLRTANDFYHAAFVFQHGNTADDFLLAHTFSIIAAALGRKDATWIAAATLDRYLQKIGQKQIYGTQFNNQGDSPLTQEPYDRRLVSDSLRAALGVPSIEQQEKERQQLEAELKAGK